MEEKNQAEEAIHVEEEETSEEAHSEERSWTEEIGVAGEELLATVKNLIREANIRRVVIKTSSGRTIVEIPLVFGVAGIVLLPAQISIIGLIGALVTDCTIAVERVEKAPPADEDEDEG